MSERFEIPMEPRGYNLFLMDDYLRTVRSQTERQKLIREVGYSAQKREDYERQCGLPRGAVELALLAEDKRVAEINDLLNKKLNQLYKEKAPRDRVNEAFREVGSRAAGIRALYPDAFQFLMQYNLLAKRNAAMFRGDYRFDNEFKIIQADCSPSSNVLSCGLDPVNTCINVNLVIFINVGVGYNVVAAVTAALAFLLWIWAAVFVIP